ncbi:hypothetical protein EDD86DRAFT_211795 [Gorgonomyces haynaldii]|nr:hypothetical protein EDD86DRAFT_211795 [Gorgonomyces haynaldii]
MTFATLVEEYYELKDSPRKQLLQQFIELIATHHQGQISINVHPTSERYHGLMDMLQESGVVGLKLTEEQQVQFVLEMNQARKNYHSKIALERQEHLEVCLRQNLVYNRQQVFQKAKNLEQYLSKQLGTVVFLGIYKWIQQQQFSSQLLIFRIEKAVLVESGPQEFVSDVSSFLLQLSSKTTVESDAFSIEMHPDVSNWDLAQMESMFSRYLQRKRVRPTGSVHETNLDKRKDSVLSLASWSCYRAWIWIMSALY